MKRTNAKTLDQYIRDAGMKANDLAFELNISAAQLSRIRRGICVPSPELAAKIEKRTGIPFKNLMLPKTAEAATR